MKFNNILKNMYRNIIFSKSVISHKFRIPSNYNDTSTDFVNNNNLSSTTKYLIWVDTNNFQVNIFSGSKNNWKLVKNYICSIGKPSTPTPLGTFKVGAKGFSFGENHGYIDNTVRDGRLGYKISNGCIRLAKVNAKWIYDNIPYGTTVFIS